MFFICNIRGNKKGENHGVHESRKKEETCKEIYSAWSKRLISNVYDVVTLGFNYRMTNMQAAIGLAQLKRVNIFIKRRKNIFNYYNNNLKKNKRITFLPNNEWSENSYWSYTIKINNLGLQKRDKLLEYLVKCNRDLSYYFYRNCNDLEIFKLYKRNNLNNIENIVSQVILLPCYPK